MLCRGMNVDLLHRVLRVRQTIGRIYNCERRVTERILSSPKTKNSYREIPISKLLFEALRSVKKQSTSTFVVGVSEYATDPRTYRDYFARLLKKLQIPYVVFHLARHRGFYKHQIINRLYCLSIKGGNDKETSELLYSILFCHFKEPLYLMQR